MNKKRLVIVVHDVRSAHNVGSILRSADGFGVDKVYLTGYTPYPLTTSDKRLPHVAARAADQVSKTALGAEKSVNWQHDSDILGLLKRLKEGGFIVIALEQTQKSVNLAKYRASSDVALIVGNELRGLDPALLKTVDIHLAIPMHGGKESFNVSVAAAVALYHLRYVAHQ